MSRFNFSNVIPQTPSTTPVLPEFNKIEVKELLQHCTFASQDLDLLEAILNDGTLLSIDELHNIYKSHKTNIYYKSFKPGSSQSLREASIMVDLLHDLNMIMCLDRDEAFSKEKKYIWSEIRVIEISKSNKRLVLAIHCDTEKQLSHQEAWGYTSKKSSSNTNKDNKGADPFA